MNSRSLKSAGLALASLGLVGVCLAGPMEAQPFASAHWKSKTEMAGGPQGDMTTEAEMWMKDGKVRVKTTAMGMNINVVKTGDFVYQWQEGQTTGMKMPANMRRRGGAPADDVNKIEDVRTRGKKIGTETVNGHACDIYEYTESTGERSVRTSERSMKQTYWLAKDMKNFPVRIVSETGSVKMTTLNSDIDLKASVPEAMLAPPDNVNFQDMSEMMKGMPKQRPN